MKSLLLAIAYLIFSSSLFCQSSDDFVTTWKTDNPGNTNSSSIFIPVFQITETSTVTGYNYDVDWDNDGIFDEFGITESVEHDYGTPGTYTIRIRGDFPMIFFNKNRYAGGLLHPKGSKDKFISIDQWGTNQWSSFEASYDQCENLVLNALDTPDLSQVVSMRSGFNGIAELNGSVGSWILHDIVDLSQVFKSISTINVSFAAWDVSKVQNFTNLFRFTPFNENLSQWDIGSATSLNSMFLLTDLSKENYDAILVGWNQLDATETQIPMNVTFTNDNIEYCNAGSARQNLIDTYNWFIEDGGVDPSCGLVGCMDISACNYDANATTDDMSCLYATGCDVCDGQGGVTNNPEVGDSCDDGDPTTINDTVQNDCSCSGVIACYDTDKAALSAMYNSFDSPSLLNWDFTPGVPLDGSWQGIIMSSDGCHVEILSLNQYLGGSLDSAVEDLSQLVFLELTDTDIAGEIPSSLGNIATLLQFQAYGNSFEGSIPESLWSLPLLEFLDLAGSNLSGPLPENAANTAALVELVLSNNNFSGCIPDAYQFFCNEYCELYDNNLLNNDFDDFCATGFGACSDVDGDGVLNENDNCENVPNTDQLDLDADAIGDVCDSDIDGDGVLNEVDCDPLDENLYEGATCDDLNASTTNDMILADCTCQGTFVDTDNDGVADVEDNCPMTANTNQADLDLDTIGDSCDDDIDGDGELNEVDCAPADPNIYLNAPCDDLNEFTENDVIQSDCTCQGTSIFDCSEQMADFGDACDDGLNTTENDIIQTDCSCTGDLIVNDNCGSPIEIEDGIYLNVKINGGGGASNNCFNGAVDALFYTYTAPLTGIATVNSGIDLDQPDTRISIYTGTCASLNCHAQNDDISTANYASNITFDIAVGDIYILEWDDRWSNDFFDFEVSSSIAYDCQDLEADFGDACDDGESATLNDVINTDCSCSGTAINSTCADAISISEGIVYGAVISNGDGASSACQSNATHAIWYLYTASIDGECTISSEIDPMGTDTRVTVFDDPCGAASCLTFNDDIDASSLNYSSLLKFPVSTGDQFLIEWDDRWSSDTFDFEISVAPFDCPVLEANVGDLCNDGDGATINDVITPSCTCVGEYSCIAADRISMETLYDGWDGPNTNLNWDFSAGSVVNSNWTGVTVNNEGCVTKIILKSKGLNGIIDPAIGDLLSLLSINIIRHPLLTGPIPSSIGDLNELRVLNLQRNNLNGNLSGNLSNISNTATIFNVKRNNITGCIPKSYDAFCGVVDVQLGNNPNWNNNSFQAFCDFNTGACIESIIGNDDDLVDGNMSNKLTSVESIKPVDFLVYPNPNDGVEVNIQLTSEIDLSQNIMLRVFDLYGKLVLSDSFIIKNGTTNKKINFNSQLSSGLYFVELLTNENKLVKKLIIE